MNRDLGNPSQQEDRTMKINIQDMPGIAQTQKTLKQNNTPTGGFEQVLEKAMSPQSGQTQATSALPPLQCLSNVGFVVPTAAERSQTVQRIDDLLNVIETYQAKMADPRVSLKETYPLVEQMEKKTAELAPVAEALPAGDKLKEILNRVLVASTVEVIKFNRGDYL
jgi:hypothetical protein